MTNTQALTPHPTSTAPLPSLSPLHDTYYSRTFGRRAFRNTLKPGLYR